MVDELNDKHLAISHKLVDRYAGLDYLICTALAQPDFAAELIANRHAALERLPDHVTLSPLERDLVRSVVGPTDIHEFAACLHVKMLELASRANNPTKVQAGSWETES